MTTRSRTWMRELVAFLHILAGVRERVGAEACGSFVASPSRKSTAGPRVTPGIGTAENVADLS